MRQKNQKMRFNDAELELMKRVFADNEDLLFIIRKVLFQFELNSKEENVLSDSLNDDIHSLLKKVFLPDLDPDAPLFQLTDLPLGLNLAMNSKGVEEMTPLFKSKQLEMDYLTQQLEVLKDRKAKQKISLSKLAELKADDYQTFINITARNWLLVFIDSSLNQIKLLAGEKNETLEQTMARLSKDSSK